MINRQVAERRSVGQTNVSRLFPHETALLRNETWTRGHCLVVRLSTFLEREDKHVTGCQIAKLPDCQIAQIGIYGVIIESRGICPVVAASRVVGEASSYRLPATAKAPKFMIVTIDRLGWTRSRAERACGQHPWVPYARGCGRGSLCRKWFSAVRERSASFGVEFVTDICK